MKSWDEYFQELASLRAAHKNAAAHTCLEEGRRRVAKNSPADWDWLETSLVDPARKAFVAELFLRQPVPRRLLNTFIRAAVYERDVSSCQWYVEPCVRSFGAKVVSSKLCDYIPTGSQFEKAGAISALYFVQTENAPDVRELNLHHNLLLLREFVSNEDLDVRRRILAQLPLGSPKLFPEEVRALIPSAILIARSHPDEYIRHRLEIQLGKGGPYKPIP